MPGSRKHYSEARRALLELGFSLQRCNGTTEFYAHPEGAVAKIYPGMGDTQAGHLVENLTKRLGGTPKQGLRKRNADAVKGRQAADRVRAAAEADRHKAELEVLVAQRESRMDGLGRLITNAQMRDLERLIEEKARAFRYWQGQMTETPTSNAHSGRPTAQHRS